MQIEGISLNGWSLLRYLKKEEPEEYITEGDGGRILVIKSILDYGWIVKCDYTSESDLTEKVGELGTKRFHDGDYGYFMDTTIGNYFVEIKEVNAHYSRITNSGSVDMICRKIGDITTHKRARDYSIKGVSNDWGI